MRYSNAGGEEALATAPSHPPPGSSTVSVAFFSYIYLQRGKTTRAIALAEQVIVEASEKEPFFNLQLAKMFGGRRWRSKGRSEEGLTVWEQGWQGFQATGCRVLNSVFSRLKVVDISG